MLLPSGKVTGGTPVRVDFRSKQSLLYVVAAQARRLDRASRRCRGLELRGGDGGGVRRTLAELVDGSCLRCPDAGQKDAAEDQRATRPVAVEEGGRKEGRPERQMSEAEKDQSVSNKRKGAREGPRWKNGGSSSCHQPS